MNLYAITIDLLLIAVFAAAVHRSYKRGFVDAVSGLLSLVGAYIAAGMFGFVLRGFLYREVFSPLVTDAVGRALSDAAASVTTSLSDALASLQAQAERLTHIADGLGIRIPIDGALPQSVEDPAALGALTGKGAIRIGAFEQTHASSSLQMANGRLREPYPHVELPEPVSTDGEDAPNDPKLPDWMASMNVG